MHDTYEPQAVEAAAQDFWQRTRAFEVDESSPKPKFYCLSMLPYPSGALHMGHVRNYTIGDVISRYQRMQGRNVLQPMGWDAFGLPAENAAIQHHTAPAKWTHANIEHMRERLDAMGYAIDWSREFATCSPDYYVHEQRLFTRLFRKGLAYRKESEVNWDPVDQTVLANEQVIDGRGWRTGAVVEKRKIPQWFLRITDYAEELLDGLDRLPGWPESVKAQQRNWIGRSEGLEIDFQVDDAEAPVTVFTTRPDTLMGCTYLAVAPDHPLARRAAETRPVVAAFIEECRHTSTAEGDLAAQEKKGVDTGMVAIHPITGERLPVWIANFVLMGYGTGAVMCVPAHDQRDWEFATRYDLLIRMVIVSPPVRDAIAELGRDARENTAAMSAALGQSGAVDVYDEAMALDVLARFERSVIEEAAYTDYGTLVNSGDYDGLDYEGAFNAIAARLTMEGRGRRRTNWRLRDWGVSRQRYWGCPIPIIYCKACGTVPVPDDQLPVLLPEDVEFSGVRSPIKDDPEWRRTSCPECGGEAERETDTFDTFMESSWYYARYTSPGAADIVDGRADYWLPVDQYIGGIEHAILHLLYFRFFHKLLRDEGLVASDEPALNLLCQGMVVADTYYRELPGGGREWFNPADVEVQRDERGRAVAAVLKSDGRPVAIGGSEKMSKSRNNGVDPQAMVARFGADTVRLFSMFAAPPDQSLEWSEAGVEGMSRFLRRLWREVVSHAAAGQAPALDVAALSPAQRELRRQVHATIQKVSDDYGRRHAFNTAIAALMELLNAVSALPAVEAEGQGRAVRQEALETLVLLLNPVTPHSSHALWQQLGHAETLIDDLAWPQADAAALERATVTLAVQVNGKLRGTVDVSPGAGNDEVEALALALPNVIAQLDGKAPRKVIVVPGRIVNIVA